MKCCANCEFSISPMEEEEIKKEQGYKEDEGPKAGDCAIGKVRDKNFVCDSHSYKWGLEEYKTDIYYEEEFFGKGYLITQKLEGNLIRFMKISEVSTIGYPHFMLRAIEKDSFDKDTPYREITFTFTKEENEKLYEHTKKLADHLKRSEIYSVNHSIDGSNYIRVVEDNDKVQFRIVKDVFGVKQASDYIHIDIGDFYTCSKYSEFYSFYQGLYHVKHPEIQEEDMKQLLKIKENQK